MAAETKGTKDSLHTPLLALPNQISPTPETPPPNKWRSILQRAIFGLAGICVITATLALTLNLVNIINGAVTQFMLGLSFLSLAVTLVGWQFFINSQKATDKQIKIHTRAFEDFYQSTGQRLAIATTVISLAAIPILIGICFPVTEKLLMWILPSAIIALLTILASLAYSYQHQQKINKSDNRLDFSAYFFTSKESIWFFLLILSFTIASLIGVNLSTLANYTFWGMSLSTVLTTFFIAMTIFVVLRQLASFSVRLLPHGKIGEHIEKLRKAHENSSVDCQALTTILDHANDISSDQILDLCKLFETLPFLEETERWQMIRWLAKSAAADPSQLSTVCQTFSKVPLLRQYPKYLKNVYHGLLIDPSIDRLPVTENDLVQFEGCRAIKAAGLEHLRTHFDNIQNAEIKRHVGSILALLWSQKRGIEEKRLLNDASYVAITAYAGFPTAAENMLYVQYIVEILINNGSLSDETNYYLLVTHTPYAKALAPLLDNILPILIADDTAEIYRPFELNQAFWQLTNFIIRPDIRETANIAIINALTNLAQKIKNTDFLSNRRNYFNYHAPIVRKRLIKILLINPKVSSFIQLEDFNWNPTGTTRDTAQKMDDFYTVLNFLNTAGALDDSEHYKKLMALVKQHDEYNNNSFPLMRTLLEAIQRNKNINHSKEIRVALFFQAAEEAYTFKENNRGAISTEKMEAILAAKIEATLNPTQNGDSKRLPPPEPTNRSSTSDVYAALATEVRATLNPIQNDDAKRLAPPPEPTNLPLASHAAAIPPVVNGVAPIGETALVGQTNFFAALQHPASLSANDAKPADQLISQGDSTDKPHPASGAFNATRS